MDRAERWNGIRARYCAGARRARSSACCERRWPPRDAAREWCLRACRAPSTTRRALRDRRGCRDEQRPPARTARPMTRRMPRPGLALALQCEVLGADLEILPGRQLSPETANATLAFERQRTQPGAARVVQMNQAAIS